MLKISANHRLILSVGELNINKNHQLVIKTLNKFNNDDIDYIIAGTGTEFDSLKKLAKNSNVNLHLLGHRNDVDRLLAVSDLFALPSIREGLNVSLMEAIASKTNVLCSNIRGNRDLIDSKCLFELNENDLLEKIELYINNDNTNIIENNYNRIKELDVNIINNQMINIYKNIISTTI